MAKETIPNRRYTDEFKLEALRLAESVGINQAAKRLGMPSSSLGNWARLKRSGKLGELPRAGPIKGSPAELQSLKQSLASVHERIPQRWQPVVLPLYRLQQGLYAALRRVGHSIVTSTARCDTSRPGE
jgi:transposase